ncbi:Rox3 mediator complex subunit-domain-containing protein [Bisporella sp. PMI_857]|nr:Rox3 mediator complex subunit-domain-containing protein [Bisporella sp. PMI_857]
MPSDHPPSPPSPSQLAFDTNDLHQKPATSPSTSLPTPAHSINGSMSSSASDFLDAAHSEEISTKRKRDMNDNGGREQKKVHIEDSGVTINDLHLNVGSSYLLHKTPLDPGAVPFSHDLFKIYSLEDIAKSVARENPDGSKKVLRKSYKGIFKKFGISGAFGEDVKEKDAPDTLAAMMQKPDELWKQEFGPFAKPLSEGSDLAPPNQLQAAFTMKRGPIPKSVWNSKVLGADFNQTLTPGSAPLAQNKATNNSGSRTPVHQVGSLQRVKEVKADLSRPKRANKKRTYGEESYEGYEGYAEGNYPDDDLQDTGYSTGGDGEDRLGARKRPKKTIGNPQPTLIPRQSYGPGGIGA